jgi:hypothetical protein
MINSIVETYNQTLLEQMEITLAHLAVHWRGLTEQVDSTEVIHNYQTILLCMLDLGLDHPLDIDSELPDELMPPAYFERFTQAK